MKRLVALTLAFLASVSAYSQVTSAPYPGHVVKIIVGFAPGGGTDLLARHYAKRLSDRLGQPFIVDNKPGKGGAVAAKAAASSPPDGYTLVVGTTGMAVDAALGENTYDWQRDLAPVAMLASSVNVLVVPEKSTIRSVADVIRQAKERRLNFGSAGVTSSMHMTGELFKQMAGIDMTHVPYRGAAPAEQALMAGEIDLMFDNLAGAMSFISAGKFRPIAVSSISRDPTLPGVPTIDEMGLKGFDTTGTFFLMAPSSTPTAVIQQLETAISEIAKEEETRAFIQRMNMVPASGGGEAVKRFLLAEYAKWKKVVSDKKFETIK